MSSIQKKNCFVQFQLNQRTSPGEDIHITGNIPSLGLWNVEKSEKMITNNKEYPLWKSRENIIVPQDTEIEYKYLIFYNKKFKCWENNQNRKVKIGKYYKVVIKDPGSQIINSVSDPNLSIISNSEISKTDNQYNEGYTNIIGADELDLTNNNNDMIFSEQNTNTMNYEEQFILSNKRNDLILPNIDKEAGKYSKEINIDNDLKKDFRTEIEYNELYLNFQDQEKSFEDDNNINNMINEITPINSQIFNNILTNNLEINNDEIEKNHTITEDKNEIKNIPNEKELLIDDKKGEGEKISIKPKNFIYSKIIICSFYLPIEIKNNEINPLSDYIYPNLFQLYKTNPNIYFIGIIKNSKNISEKNKQELYQKLINEYRMYPLDINDDFIEKLFKYINEYANPFLNDVQINISNIKNNDIKNLIEEIHLKFNEIVYKTIIDIAKQEKILLLLFDYYFIFIPQILQKNYGNKLYNNIGIQFIFLSKICSKQRFISIPDYNNIIKSILYSNIILFPSYYNCYQFLNLIKSVKEYNYKVNVEGDIILDINSQEQKNENINFNHNLVLRVENIFPDYQLYSSLINENKITSDIEQIISNIKKKNNNFIFLSIDDIKYEPFIKIKLQGLKSFIENISDEKYKISFILVITGEYIHKKEETNNFNINSNININEEKKEIEKGNNNEINLSEIIGLINEINTASDNKIIELIYRNITLNEKLFLLNNADCFIKTLEDVHSPFSIYEYLMTKLIYTEKLKKKENINNKETIQIKEKLDFPIVEYIINNQIKEIPGLSKFIYVNPYDIKNICSEFSAAFRNLIICHKNISIHIYDYSKEKDFNYIKKYFDIEKIHYNKEKEENIIKHKEIINDNDKEKLIKIDINDIIKNYDDVIKISSNDQNKDKIGKIISINIDYFFNDKEKENDIEKFYFLLSNVISFAANNKNKILLYSNKEEEDLDNIIIKYIEKQEKEFVAFISHLNNIILISDGGYSFKKLSKFMKEEDENTWIKLQPDLEEFPYSEKEIYNNLSNYKDNCPNIKIEKKSNKIYVYNDDCNKDQLDLYMDHFKDLINNDDNYKNILHIKKIKNGYCIINIFNYKALFFSKILKEMVNKGKLKFILILGFDKTDEILYKYLDKKKSILEKYIKEKSYIYCIKFIKYQKFNFLEEKNDKENININQNNNNIDNHSNILFHCDNIDEIISLFKKFVDLENKGQK